MPISPLPAILVEAGVPPSKISNMTAAAALTGAELVPLVQNALNVRSTVLAIAALATATPSAPVNSIQFNNAGAFGGSANATFVSPLTTLHTLTVSTGDLTVTPGVITTGNTNPLQIKTSGGKQVEVEHASPAVNWVGMGGAVAAGPGPYIASRGSDTNIDFRYFAKGTGVHNFSSNSAFQFAVGVETAQASVSDVVKASGGNGNAFLKASGGSGTIHLNFTSKNGNFFFYRDTPLTAQIGFQINPAGGATPNYLIANGAASGANSTITAGGNDSQRNINLTPTGGAGPGSYIQVIEFSASSPSFKVYSRAGSASPTNYFELYPSQTATNIIIGAAGGDANIGITLRPKGSGTVVTEPGTGTTLTMATAAATQVDLYNTVAMTINAFGVATAITLGATTGTLTLRNATIANPNATAFTIGADPGGGNVLRVGGALTVNSATMIATKTAFTNGAAAQVGTLTNAPAAGDPTKWIPVDDNGTTRYIPAW